MDDDILDSFLLPTNPSGRLRTRLLEDGRTVEFHSATNRLGPSNRLTLEGQAPQDGRYTLNDGITRFEVLSGIIVHEYYVERYKSGTLTILVDCSRVNGFTTGCMVYTEDGPLPDGIYRLKRFKWVKAKDGMVERKSMFRID